MINIYAYAFIIYHTIIPAGAGGAIRRILKIFIIYHPIIPAAAGIVRPNKKLVL